MLQLHFTIQNYSIIQTKKYCIYDHVSTFQTITHIITYIHVQYNSTIFFIHDINYNVGCVEV